MGDNTPTGQNGLGLNELRLVPHNAEWGSLYQAEADALSALPQLIEVMHIGSTALSRVDTKPVIDLAALVSVAPDDSGLREQLTELDYRDRGEYGLPGRQFYTKGEPPQFHLHVVAKREGHWDDWRDFRDYLRDHPEWQTKYQEEKYRIAQKTKGDRALYTQEKGEFIKKVLDLARENTDGEEKTSNDETV